MAAVGGRLPVGWLADELRQYLQASQSGSGCGLACVHVLPCAWALWFEMHPPAPPHGAPAVPAVPPTCMPWPTAKPCASRRNPAFLKSYPAPALPPLLQAGLLGGDASRIHVNPDCGLKTRR